MQTESLWLRSLSPLDIFLFCSTVTITSWTGEDIFKGYMLIILDQNSTPVGEFSSSHRTICGGDAVTHSNGGDKLFEAVNWTAPEESTGHTYHIW